jgi:adenylate kinase
MTQQIIVITGTPGVGKTTISKALANRIKGKHIDISALVQREHLVKGRDDARDSVIVDITRLTNRLQQIIFKQAEIIILDGHCSAEAFSDLDISLVIVVRLDPDELKTRLQARGYKETKIFENVAAEILDVCLFDALQQFEKELVTEINATNRDVEEIIAIILKTLEGQINVRIGWVNWLEKLENENRLEEFFTDINATDDSGHM